MRIFISHSSKDKPAVEPLVHALRKRGFDPWSRLGQLSRQLAKRGTIAVAAGVFDRAFLRSSTWWPAPRT